MVENSMVRGKCPMCQSDEVYYGRGMSIELNWRSHIRVRRYVCMQCGYIENYARPTPRQKQLIRRLRGWKNALKTRGFS